MHLPHQQLQQLQHRLLVRVRSLVRLKSLPDPLLGQLLANADPLPEQVPHGIILFRQGEHLQDWYLLLSGEVQLYLEELPTTSNSRNGESGELANGNGKWNQRQQLAIVRPGTLFGELQSIPPSAQSSRHSCAARVLKSAEFVRIRQDHFLNVYNKWADQLQQCMLPMEDLTGALLGSMPSISVTTANGAEVVGQPRKGGNSSSRQLPRSPSERRRNRTRSREKGRIIGNGEGEGAAAEGPSTSSNKIRMNGGGGRGSEHLNGLFNTARSSNNSGSREAISTTAAATNHQQQRRRTENGHHSAGGRRIAENGHYKKRSMGRSGTESGGNGAAAAGGGGVHLLEFLNDANNPMMATERVQTAAIQIGRILMSMSSTNNSSSSTITNHIVHHHQIITGSEFCANLHVLWVQLVGHSPPSPLSTLAVGQAFFDAALLVPSRLLFDHQPQFINSPSANYQWALPSSSSSNGQQEMADNQQQQQQRDQQMVLMDSLLFLANVGADSLLQCILRKPEEQREDAELQLVHEEISHIRAFNHLSRGMKWALARVIRWESPEHAGTIIFREGEPARSWYVVLRGTLEAKANGRKSLLREGDDFGKLALLNGGGGGGNNGVGAPMNGNGRRQATVICAQDGCQLLRVDSGDFQRILREVEADTIRLKQPTTMTRMEAAGAGAEDGHHRQPQKDVLVLQRNPPKGRHFLVAGLPEIILEYVLETRAELGADECEGEHLLEELLLTHSLWMPSNRLCDALKVYYATGALGTPHQLDFVAGNPHSAMAHRRTAKRRCVHFVMAWHTILGDRFFLDPVANSFVEELYSCLLEDAQMEEMNGGGGGEGGSSKLGTVLAQMQLLMGQREQTMQSFCRAPRLLLDCGAYTLNAPAPNSALPSDICNQAIMLPDSSQLTLQIRLDQSASEIAQLARLGGTISRNSDEMAKTNGSNGAKSKAMAMEEECLLFELCPDGQKLAIGGAECSVPTQLSPGSILLAALRSETSRLPAISGPTQVRPSMHSSLVLLLGPDRLARAMALFHFKLLCATSQAELLIQVISRDQFTPRLAPSNLDLLLRRFGQLQHWASSEVLLAPDSTQRLAVLRGLIQLAQRAKANRDLLAMAALSLGLSALPISRLGALWERLPEWISRMHAQNQSLLLPARGHRNYRLYARSLRPPFVPFVPLLLKELDFVHERRPNTLGENGQLVSWEKMHMMGRLLRQFRKAKGGPNAQMLMEQMIARMERDNQIHADEALVRNLHALEDQAELMAISNGIQQREGVD